MRSRACSESGSAIVVTVEVLEGDRRVREVRVTALAHEMFGLTAYMSLPALHAVLGSEPVVSAVLLSVDPRFDDDIDARLKRMPRVAAVSRRRDVIAHFRKQSAETMTPPRIVLTLFGCAIAVAVVYNNARIALSMRSRDLASLRVLGFTRREISSVLLGELGAYVALAIVPGAPPRKGPRGDHDLHGEPGAVPDADDRDRRDLRVRRRRDDRRAPCSAPSSCADSSTDSISSPS